MNTPERFWARVEQGDGCWLWTGGVAKTGYGRIMIGGKPRLAHRYAYESLVGPIADDLHIDHLCRVRRCVRPDHLEPVTAGENNLRGDSPWALNARKATCPEGHAYDKVDHRGARVCSPCERRLKRDRDRRRRLRMGMKPRVRLPGHPA